MVLLALTLLFARVPLPWPARAMGPDGLPARRHRRPGGFRAMGSGGLPPGKRSAPPD